MLQCKYCIVVSFSDLLGQLLAGPVGSDITLRGVKIFGPQYAIAINLFIFTVSVSVKTIYV